MLNVTSLFLALIITISGFFSTIGENGMGYFNLAFGASQLENVSYEGKLNVQISDEMRAEAMGKMPRAVTIAISANMQSKPETYMDGEITVNLPEVSSKLKYVIIKNEIFIEKNSYFDFFIKTIHEFSDVDDIEHYGKIQARLLDEFAGVEYIKMGEATGSTELMQGMDKNQIVKLVKELQNAPKGEVAKVFDNTANGYSMKLNTDNLLSGARAILSNISTDKAGFLEHSKKVMSLIYDMAPSAYMTKEEYLAKETSGGDELFGMIDTLLAQLGDVNLQRNIDIFDGTHVKSSIEKSGRDYIFKSSAALVYGNTAAFTLTSEGKMYPNMGIVRKVVDAKKTVEFEKMGERFTELGYEITPMTDLDISLYRNSIASVVAYRDGDSGSGQQVGMFFLNVDDRVYVPVDIFKYYGQTITVDAAEKKVVLERLGTKFTLDTIERDSMTYIAARDFEKLGYTVTFKGQTEGEDEYFENLIGTIQIKKIEK